MSKGSLGINPLFDSIIDTEQKEKKSQILEFSQLERDLQFQEEFLQDQDTKMGVSKNAMGKYPTFKGIPTQVMILCTFLGISYGAKEGVFYILNEIDKSPQQENIIQDTQDDMQHVLLIDTTDVWHDTKDTLQTDVFEELQQFPIQAQQ